jgi:hypothetical protein
MRFSIRPGKVTCAGIVVIFMVLPNSIWKGPDAKVAPVSKVKLETANAAKKTARDSHRPRLKFREVPR